jgi:hypothetical protein
MSARAWSLRRFVVHTIAGEAVGFAAAMALGRGVVAVVGDRDDAWFVLGLSAAAGALEGACLGLAQSPLLRRLFPRLGVRRWTAATMLGGAAAWALGMFAGARGFAGPPPAWLVPLVVVGSGLVLGGILGAVQSLALRTYVPTVRPWIVASALGWTIGLLFAYAGVALTPGPELRAVDLAVLALAGSAMAVAPAWITGLALQRLARRP